jgi:ATP-binding cassette subfamily B multidrug efflux pump
VPAPMSILRRLLPYYTPYRGAMIVGLVCVVLSSAVGTLVPWLLRGALDAIGALQPRSVVWRYAAGMIGVALVAGALRYTMRELLNGISRKIEYDLRNDLFRHLETLDAAYYAQVRTGDLMARLTNDLSAVRMAVGPAVMYLTNTIFGGVFALAFMVSIDLRLTILALLPLLALPFLIVRLGGAIHRRFEAVQEKFGDLTTLAQENLAGVRIVRAYRQEEAERARFDVRSEEYLERNLALARLYGMMSPGFGLVAGLATVVVLGVGGRLVVTGTITVGSFVAFGFYLAMLTWPMIALGWVINLFQRGSASMKRLAEILDARPVVVSPDAPRSLPPAAAGRELEFRNVSFHFPTPAGQEPRWVLRNISFRVPAGSTLGIVGATGSGKSTLMDLVPRLHEPQEGVILMDGVPVSELSLEELRGEIGYAPQESMVFSETIGSNLAYSDVSEQAVREAAEIAQLVATIQEMPSGYDTMLGERGINLSGGQRQRASLARALARRPHVVLLDDALSAVDTSTEAEILRGLRTALSGRTALISSHRISAVKDADQIVVLADGRIVEQGTHAELTALQGRYWSLLRRQQLVESIEDMPAAASIGSATSAEDEPFPG